MNREKTVWVGRPPAIEYLQKSKDKYYRAYNTLRTISKALWPPPPDTPDFVPVATPWLGLNTSWRTYYMCLDEDELEEKRKKIGAQKLDAQGKYMAARDLLNEAKGITPAAAAASEDYQ